MCVFCSHSACMSVGQGGEAESASPAGNRHGLCIPAACVWGEETASHLLEQAWLMSLQHARGREGEARVLPARSRRGSCVPAVCECSFRSRGPTLSLCSRTHRSPPCAHHTAHSVQQPRAPSTHADTAQSRCPRGAEWRPVSHSQPCGQGWTWSPVVLTLDLTQLSQPWIPELPQGAGPASPP